MKKRPFLFALLCLSTACASSEEQAEKPPPPKAERAAAAPIVPAKKAQPAAPIVSAKPAESASGSVAALPLIPAGKTDAAAGAPAVGTRAERFAALESEHEKVMEAYYDLFRAAKTNEEAQEIAKTAKEPDTKPFVERAKALLAEDPKDETAVSVIRWLFENARERDGAGELCALLEKHHFESPAVADMLYHLANAGPAGSKLIDRLAEKSPHESVRGRAWMQLAEAALQERRYAEMLMEMPKEERGSFEEYLGAERVEALKSLDPAQTEARAVAIFERVQKDYGAVKIREGTPYESTLGASAAANLFEIRNLGVGKVAPDIDGEDIAGVPFKLSDYRGKVVMLDFWGFW